MARKVIPNYVTASIAISLGGFLNGYDTGGIGAIMQMDEFKETIGDLSPFMLGFTVSLIMLAGTIPSVFAGYLADKLGRLKVVMAGSILFALGAVIQGTSFALPQFLLGRALGGFGEGVFLSNVSVYICEVSPAKNRGILAGLPQFMATAGICVGYFTCYATIAVQSSMAWRAPYVVQSILAAVLVAICLVLPDSPRWLMSHGKRVEALRALKQLNFSMIEAERDFMTPTDQQSSLSLWQGFTLMFRKGYRAQTILAFFVLGMVQLSGIDGVLYVRSLSSLEPRHR
jgi:MFS family permease